MSSGQTDASRGAGWPSVKHTVKRRDQVSAADLISVAGHSLSCTKHLLRVNVSVEQCSTGNSGTRKCHALETLLCPRPGPVNASGLCRETLLVSVELGGGAATGALVTEHQEGERERRSNQRQGLRAYGPDAPAQSALYIRKEHQEGSALCRPVRRQAPSLPSRVTRSQSD